MWPPKIFLFSLLAPPCIASDDFEPVINLISRTLGSSADARHKLSSGIKDLVITKQGTAFARYVKGIKASGSVVDHMEASIPHLSDILAKQRLTNRSNDVIEASLELIDKRFPAELLGSFWGLTIPSITQQDGANILKAIIKLDSLEAQIRYYNLMLKRFDVAFTQHDMPMITDKPFAYCSSLAKSMLTKNLKNARAHFLTCTGDQIDVARVLTINAIFMDFAHIMSPSNVVASNHWVLTKEALDMALSNGARYIVQLHKERRTESWMALAKWLSSGEVDPTEFIKQLPLATISMLLFDTQLHRAEDNIIHFDTKLLQKHSGAIQLLRTANEKRDPMKLFLELDHISHQLYPRLCRDSHRVQDDREGLVTALLQLHCYLPTQHNHNSDHVCRTLGTLRVHPMIPVHEVMSFETFRLLTITPTQKPISILDVLPLNRMPRGSTTNIAYVPSFDRFNDSPSIPSKASSVTPTTGCKKADPSPTSLTIKGMKKPTLNDLLEPLGIKIAKNCDCDTEVECQERAQLIMSQRITDTLATNKFQPEMIEHFITQFNRLKYTNATRAFMAITDSLAEGPLDPDAILISVGAEPMRMQSSSTSTLPKTESDQQFFSSQYNVRDDMIQRPLEAPSSSKQDAVAESKRDLCTLQSTNYPGRIIKPRRQYGKGTPRTPKCAVQKVSKPFVAQPPVPKDNMQDSAQQMTHQSLGVTQKRMISGPQRGPSATKDEWANKGGRSVRQMAPNKPSSPEARTKPSQRLMAQLVKMGIGKEDAGAIMLHLTDNEPQLLRRIRGIMRRGQHVSNGFVNWLKARTFIPPGIIRKQFREQDWIDSPAAIRSVLADLLHADPAAATYLQGRLTNDADADFQMLLRSIKVMLNAPVLEAKDKPTAREIANITRKLQRIMPEIEARRTIHDIINQDNGPLVLQSVSKHLEGNLKTSRGFLAWLRAKARFGSAIPNEYHQDQWDSSETSKNTILGGLRRINPNMANDDILDKDMQADLSAILRPQSQLRHAPTKRKIPTIPTSDKIMDLLRLVQQQAQGYLPSLEAGELAKKIVTHSPALIKSLPAYFHSGAHKTDGFWNWLMAKARFGKSIPDSYNTREWTSPEESVTSILKYIGEHRPNLARKLQQNMRHSNVQDDLNSILKPISIPNDSRKDSQIKLPKLRPLAEKSSHMVDDLEQPRPLKPIKLSDDNILDIAKQALNVRNIPVSILRGAERRVIDILRASPPDQVKSIASLAAILRSARLLEIFRGIRGLLKGNDVKVLLDRIASYDTTTINKLEDTITLPKDKNVHEVLLRLIYPDLASFEEGLAIEDAHLANAITNFLLQDENLTTLESEFLKTRGINFPEASLLLKQLLDPSLGSRGSFSFNLRETFRNYVKTLRNFRLSEFLPRVQGIQLPDDICTNAAVCLGKLKSTLLWIMMQRAIRSGIITRHEARLLTEVVKNLDVSILGPIVVSFMQGLQKGAEKIPGFAIWFKLKCLKPTSIRDQFDMKYWGSESGKREALQGLISLYPEAEEGLRETINKLHPKEAMQTMNAGLIKAIAVDPKGKDPNVILAVLQGAAENPRAAKLMAQSSDPLAKQATTILGVSADQENVAGLHHVARLANTRIDTHAAQRFGQKIWASLRSMLGRGVQSLSDKDKIMVSMIMKLAEWGKPEYFSSNQTPRGAMQLMLETELETRPGQVASYTSLINMADEKLLKVTLDSADSGANPTDIIAKAAVAQMLESTKGNDVERARNLLGLLANLALNTEIPQAWLPTAEILKQTILSSSLVGSWRDVVQTTLLGSPGLDRLLNQTRKPELLIPLISFVLPHDRFTLGQRVQEMLASAVDPMPAVRSTLWKNWKCHDKNQLMRAARQHVSGSLTKTLQQLPDEQLLLHELYGPIAMDFIIANF